MKEKGLGAKMKPSGIGGMSVMEGVMMRNKDIYAVAVRKPDKEIAVEIQTHKNFSDKVKLFKLPIFRGMLAFVDSLVVGIKVLNYSASFFEEEEEAQNKKKNERQTKSKGKDAEADFEVEEVSATNKSAGNKTGKKEAAYKIEKKDESSNTLLTVLAVLISIILSVALFMVLPVLLTNLFSKVVTNHYLLAFIEGVVRLAIFIGYIILASQMNEIKRVFMYHGAEHKTINCIEHGHELTVENVRWQSRQHKRCGTSFMLLVVLISLVFFMIIPSGNLLWRVLSRVILIPLIAGVSYEFIRLAGKSESKVVHVLSQPGLWMQGLTTKEPDDSMIEVAIKSVEAVFDWRAFLEKNNKKGSTAKAGNKKKNNSNVKQAQATKKQTPPEKKTPDTKEAPDATAAASETPVKAHSEVKAGIGGLAYIGKAEASEKNVTQPANQIGRNRGTAPVDIKPNIQLHPDEEDDEILKALDKFFDEGKKDD
jgi:uncharacterized protein YqhQ